MSKMSNRTSNKIGISSIQTIPSLLYEVLGNDAISEKKVVLQLCVDGKLTHKLTGRDIIKKAESVSAFLQNLGISPGNKVILTGPSHPDWCISYLGILATGAIAVPLDPELPPAAMTAIFEDCEPSAVIHAPAMEGVIRQADQESCFPKIAMNEPALWSAESLESVKMDVTAKDRNNTASIIYTSGTTGRPKGVILTHANFCANAESIISMGMVGSTDHLLSILPLHHVYPFMVTFLAPLVAGASVTFLQSLKGPEILETMRLAGVTILPGVPRLFGLMYQAMENAIESKPAPVRRLLHSFAAASLFIRDHLSLNAGRLVFASAHRKFGRKFRFFVSGGAKLPPEVSSGMESLGFTIFEGYGLTETSPVAAFNRPGLSKRGSVGCAVPGVELKIESAGSGNTGEVLISGPNVMKGYYRMPGETAKAIRGGWLHTGDIGFIDSDGYLHITGRSKEIIVLSSGKNVYPEDVEERFLREPSIGEICIFGAQNRSSGQIEAVEALIVPDEKWITEMFPRDESTPAKIYEMLRKVVARVSDELPPYQRPRGFKVFRESLPRTSLGKLRRFKIAELLKNIQRPEQQPALSSSDMELLDSKVGRMVTELLISRMADPSAVILPNHDLELDLGLDSLGRVELLGALNISDNTSKNISESDIRTVKQLISAISRSTVGAKDEKDTGISTGWDEILSRPPEDEDIRRMTTCNKKHSFSEVVSEVTSKPVSETISKTISETISEDISETLSRLARNIFRGAFRLFFDFHVIGSENIPSSGPAIIASNHESYLDGFAVGAAVDKHILEQLYTVGLEEFFRGVLSSPLSIAAHVIPIDAERYLERAMRMSAHVLKEGNVLSIFPEGARSYDGELMEFKKGVGILAVELNVPIVPCRIEGTFEAWSRHMRFPGFRRSITVKFAPPFLPSEVLGRVKGISKPEAYDFVVKHLRNEIRHM